MEQEKNTLSVLQIAPGQHPKPIEIDNDLKALQQAVGGSIGASYPFEDPVAIVYNDDGKLMGLPLNRALRDESGEAYEVKRGKFTSVKGVRQKRFIRFRTLGAGYSEEELKAVLAGEAEHCPRKKHPMQEQKFQMLVDIQAKLAEGKGDGYARWAKRYNLKEMSKTLIFLQENKIGSMDEIEEQVRAATMRYHELGDSIKAAEARMAEIAVMKTHIKAHGMIAEKPNSIYQKGGYTKKDVEKNILSNPFKRFEDMRFLMRCKDVETVEVNPIIFRKLTRKDWLHIVDVCDKSLEKYYMRFKNN